MQRSALAILTMLCALAYAGYSQTAAPAPAPLPRLHVPERQAAIAAGGGKDGEQERKHAPCYQFQRT